MDTDNISPDDLYKLQDIVTGNNVEVDSVRRLYYKSEVSIINDEDGDKKLLKGFGYNFFTYFNSFSIEKWKKYTKVNNIYLILEASGDFIIELFGYFKNKEVYNKELIETRSYDGEEKRIICFKFPNEIKSILLGFHIRARSDVKISKAYYATDIDRSVVNEPFISMVTTTFKKEFYVKKNIELLKEGLFADNNYKDNFCWNIVDNGRTLDPEEFASDKIRVIPNKNVGGAGGFSRGIIESLNDKQKPTHILLMDDDVVFIPESFKRLCTMLRLIRDEYANHFVSGAMLKMGEPNIQHEDIGILNTAGYHEALKPNYDLSKWRDIIDNEIIREKHPHQYAAWWFCCIPADVASTDNLPLPVFFRGDDVEFSLRNKAEIITMNGICIWHEGFEGKFSAALEYYQVNRNELAVRAMHPELHDVDCIGHIKIIFWEEIYKFNYKGANLLLDAVEDYMKGPDYVFGLDGEKVMKEKKEQDNKPIPLPHELKKKIDEDKLYRYSFVKGSIKKIYDYTYNGQARIPEKLLNKKTGIIPYGWGYFPAKMVLTDKNLAVDLVNNTYVVFKKSRSKFNELKARFDRVMSQYDHEHERIEKEYRDKKKEVTGKHFWNKYLGIDQ